MIDIDEIFKDRRRREADAKPEKSEAEAKRAAERARQDEAVGAAIERAHK